MNWSIPLLLMFVCLLTLVEKRLHRDHVLPRQHRLFCAVHVGGRHGGEHTIPCCLTAICLTYALLDL